MQSPATPVPHVIAWNLTKRCNLTCAHCYISAGAWHGTVGELSTDTCRRVINEILAVNPHPMLILSGGEPLLRQDLEDLAQHAKAGGATVVVGTNGTLLRPERIASLQTAGVTGVAVSIESLRASYHDRFRHGKGSLADTIKAVESCRQAKLDFVVQTTVTTGNRHELQELIAWSAEMGAVSFNLYFIVETGRGEGMPGLSPHENDEVLQQIVGLQREYRGRLMIRTKCQPQIMRHVYEQDRESPLLNYETRCPCGVQYCRITPEGKVTPCPYTPTVAGDLNEMSFGDIWRLSPVFAQIRTGELGGKCGTCEYQKLCGGCRARAVAQDGDLLGADLSCVYEPQGNREVIEPPRAITYGMPTDVPLSLKWSDEARARVQRIPSFVRNVVTTRVEKFARDRGYAEVTPEVMDEVRRSMPIDFSKKLPFFLRK